MLEMVKRAASRRLQTDRVRVTRDVPGPPVLNSATLAVSRSQQLVYEGPAMYGNRLSGHPRDTGYADLREHHGVVRVPLPCPTIRVDDEITFLTGSLAGSATFRVESVVIQTFEATRRFQVERLEREVMQS